MTDPELQALAEKMMEALRPYTYHHRIGIFAARAAVDFFAARVARADAIEAAARPFLDLALCNAPDVPIPWGDPAVTGLVSALAAVEAS